MTNTCAYKCGTQLGKSSTVRWPRSSTDATVPWLCLTLQTENLSMQSRAKSHPWESTLAESRSSYAATSVTLTPWWQKKKLNNFVMSWTWFAASRHQLSTIPTLTRLFSCVRVLLCKGHNGTLIIGKACNWTRGVQRQTKSSTTRCSTKMKESRKSNAVENIFWEAWDQSTYKAANLALIASTSA